LAALDDGLLPELLGPPGPRRARRAAQARPVLQRGLHQAARGAASGPRHAAQLSRSMAVLSLAGLLLLGPALARDASAPVATEWRVHPGGGRLPTIRAGAAYGPAGAAGRAGASAARRGHGRLRD